jgi:uncharacterized protein YgiM (DUF1202 family)
MTQKKMLIAGAAALVALRLGVAIAEDVTVQRETLDVRSGKGAMFGSVAQVHKGDTLTVIDHDGKWLKVSVNGKEGWVFEDALAARKSNALGDAARALSGDSSASDTSSSAAAKGLDSFDYAKSKNLNPAGLEAMEQARQRVTPEAWEAFMKEGHVGTAKP